MEDEDDDEDAAKESRRQLPLEAPGQRDRSRSRARASGDGLHVPRKEPVVAVAQAVSRARVLRCASASTVVQLLLELLATF